MIDIQRAFRELALRNDDVRALLGDRIAPNVAQEWAPDNEPDVYAVYHIIDRERPRTFLKPERLAHTHMQLDIYAREYDVAHDTASKVEIATNGFNGVVEVTDDSGTDSLRVRSVELITIEDIYEPSTDAREYHWHRVSLDFMIWHEVPSPVVV